MSVNGKKIIIWGTGIWSEVFSKRVDVDNIVCYCDNDEKKCGRIFLGKKVVSFEQVKKIIDENPDIGIVIASYGGYGAIVAQIKKSGYGDNIILAQNFENEVQLGDECYYSGLYDDAVFNVKEYKKEFYQGKRVKKCQKIEINTEKDSYLPVKSSSKIFVEKASTNETYEGLLENRYHLLPIQASKPINVMSEDDWVLGEPIKKFDSKGQNEVVLVLMIDSLSQSIIDEYGFENLMPHTARYLKKSICFDNCYCNVDWTLPGVATIMTGKYSMEHKFVDPAGGRICSDMITTKFRKAEYFCSYITSSWRMAPEYGYVKDMDRVVYVPGYEKGVAYELIANAMEQIDAFPHRKQFMILGLYDLHHFIHEVPNITSMTKFDFDMLFYKDEFVGKSVNKGLDITKQKIYVEQVKQLDRNLQVLYLYLSGLEQHGRRVKTIFCADHGVAYIKSKTYVASLGDPMIKVPLIIKEPGIEKNILVHKFIDNRAIYSILDSFLNNDETMDHVISHTTLPYVYNEAIYPNQKYKARIIDSSFDILYESRNELDNDCIVTWDDGIFTILSNKHNLDADQMIDKYKIIVKEHIELQRKKQEE